MIPYLTRPYTTIQDMTQPHPMNMNPYLTLHYLAEQQRTIPDRTPQREYEGVEIPYLTRPDRTVPDHT